MANSEDEDEEDDDDDEDKSINASVLYTVLAFSLINFVAIIASGVMQLTKSTPKPMASSSNNL